METSTNENSQHTTVSPNDINHDHDILISNLSNHGGGESNDGFAEEEIRGILEVIAATGKFWHNWDKLKNMLSFHLKQVLSEYPEAKMASDQQISSLGETFPELVKRLDDALYSFVEGPPFTLQRLCENLLVTSTLTISPDPYPPTMQKSDVPDEGCKEPQLQQSNALQNGVEPMVGDTDEIMSEVEVEVADVNDDMAFDLEALEETVGSSETNSAPANHS
ncbi:uncharacterized protein LOC132268191 isoform X2 [Cornus florida]|uniref:uncharacterized protein LOC132268191 isoform X2 n=1 Tax=Cornus florida TaxID=4283 RepID=UPI00289F67FE|nr:uncharacterized protein LOC132268191 isoform X2 [Cornus florida]